MTGNLPKKLEQWGTNKFHVECAKRGLDLREVARRCGRNLRYVKHAVATEFDKAEALKWLIEAKVFRYKEALWSPLETLRLRGKLHATTGEDPFLLDRPGCESLARRLGVSLARTPRTVVEIRARLLAHAAVIPTPKPTT